MRVTVFTSNQPRHIALIETLTSVADDVFAVMECNTLFPGQVNDFFRKSPTMQAYFSRVTAAERTVFGGPRFIPANARALPVKMGDVSRLSATELGDALKADAFIVFGSSYIRGDLCEFLVERKAVNIHMGVSPFYRGSSTNFWAMYDGRPQYVGATIHRLTKGLDSGPILRHAFPAAAGRATTDPFVYGMAAVRAGHRAVARHLLAGDSQAPPGHAQNRSQELRYTRNADFTDAVAAEYLARPFDAESFQHALVHRAPHGIVDVYVDEPLT